MYILSDSELKLPAAIRELSRVIAHEQPAIIQSFNTDGNLIAYLAMRRTPVSYFFASLRNTNKSRLEMLVERRIKHAYTRVIVNSIATKEELVRSASMQNEDIEIIHNGIDTDFFRPSSEPAKQALRRRYDIPANAYVVISVGRIARQKNHECTIRALALLRDRIGSDVPVVWLCLGLVENKSYFRQLRRLIKAHHLDNICRFIESAAEVPEYYGLADVSVLSSYWEGMPNALLESMACERLAIVADSADNDGIVQTVVNGLSFTTNNAEMLADALVLVKNMDGKMKREIERRARTDIINHYNMDTMVRRYQELYRQHTVNSLGK